MSHNPPRRLHLSPAATLSPVAAVNPGEPPETLAMRQLRHQTKNALQRIIAQIACTALRETPSGGVLADQLENRIRLSARVSDALFGLTEAPGPLESRLRALGDATVALLADTEQTITVEVTVSGRCPEAQQTTIVQIAHEMLGNAVKHGFHMRLVGRIVVRVQADAQGATLTVGDDGWGPVPSPAGDGLPIMRCLAEQHGGTVSLAREAGWTVARLRLPCTRGHGFRAGNRRFVAHAAA